jgi:hypothetical protein
VNCTYYNVFLLSVYFYRTWYTAQVKLYIIFSYTFHFLVFFYWFLCCQHAGQILPKAASIKQKAEQAWSIERGYMFVFSIGYFVLHVSSRNNECTAHVTNQPGWTAVGTVWEMVLCAAGKPTGWHTSLHERYADLVNIHEQHADSPCAQKRARATQTCRVNTTMHKKHAQ